MNLNTQYPILTGDNKKDINVLYNWAVELVDELKNVLLKLDSSNVSEAGSVKAENINTNTARIKDAQIKSLTANKLTAGTIDANDIEVRNINAYNINTGKLIINDNMGIENENGTLYIDSNSITMLDNENNKRIQLGSDGMGYMFTLLNKEGDKGLFMSDDGDVMFTGMLATGEDAFVGNNLTLSGNRWSSIRWEDDDGREVAYIYFDPPGRSLTFGGINSVHFACDVYDSNNNPIIGVNGGEE